MDRGDGSEIRCARRRSGRPAGATESKADSNQDKVEDLQKRVSAHDQKLQATDQVVVAIEQLLTSKIADFDQRIEAQERSLLAMNSSIAQGDELLERVLDLVQNLSPLPAGMQTSTLKHRDSRDPGGSRGQTLRRV